MVEWTMEWTLEWTMELKETHIFHSNTQLYCVAICLLAHSLLALAHIGLHSCSLLEVVGVKGHVHI